MASKKIIGNKNFELTANPFVDRKSKEDNTDNESNQRIVNRKVKKSVAPNGDNAYAQLRTDAEQSLYNNIQAAPENKDIETFFRGLQVHQKTQNNEIGLSDIELDNERGKFSGIYDLAPVGYFILDTSGVIKDVNMTGMALLETEKANIVGTRLQSFVTDDHSEIYYSFFMQMLKSRTIQQCNLELKKCCGKTFHCRMEGITRPISDGPAECYITLVDISDRINAELELAEIKDRLELSLQVSLAGTWELDLSTMSFFMDENCQKICNMPEGGFAGHFNDFLKLIHPGDRIAVENRFHKSINGHTEIDLTCRFGQPQEKECYTVIRGHVIPSAHPHKRFGGIMLDITEKTQMERSSTVLREEYQRKIAAAMINVEENERRRISESLHDSVSQLLYGVKMQLDQLEKTMQASGIKTIRKLLDQAINETRNISFELAPSILTDFGLSATLEELATRLSSRDLKIKVQISGFLKRMDILLETNIYRIIQELVNNSMKHSDASQITVDVTKSKYILIVVKDNGKGFNVKEHESSSAGSGLSSIKNRLRIYNGSIQIESDSTTGTVISVKLYENPSDTAC